MKKYSRTDVIIRRLTSSHRAEAAFIPCYNRILAVLPEKKSCNSDNVDVEVEVVANSSSSGSGGSSGGGKWRLWRTVSGLLCRASTSSRVWVLGDRRLERYSCRVNSLFWSGLVPDLEEAVPGSGGDRHAVLGDPQAAHAVVVSSQDPSTVLL